MTTEKFKQLEEIQRALRARELIAEMFHGGHRIEINSMGPSVSLDQELIDAITPIIDEQLAKYQQMWEEA